MFKRHVMSWDILREETDQIPHLIQYSVILHCNQRSMVNPCDFPLCATLHGCLWSCRNNVLFIFLYITVYRSSSTPLVHTLPFFLLEGEQQSPCLVAEADKSLPCGHCSERSKVWLSLNSSNPFEKKNH